MLHRSGGNIDNISPCSLSPASSLHPHQPPTMSLVFSFILSSLKEAENTEPLTDECFWVGVGVSKLKCEAVALLTRNTLIAAELGFLKSAADLIKFHQFLLLMYF